MIGIGIIGAGDFGASHAKAIREVEGVRVVAACREDRAALEAFISEHGGTGYADWRELLADDSVDVVLIAAPHALHAEMAIGAARAGKHIFLEKPMAPTVAECDAIIAAAAKSGVKLMVGHLVHFSKPCMAAKKAIDDGLIGRPLIASSWMIKLWMEHNRRDWHLRTTTGGGMLMTAGIHALDRLVWLMDDDVASVSAMLGAKFHEQEADDASMLSLRFKGGGMGQVQSVGYRNAAVTFAMDLVGENGALRIDMDRGASLGKDGVWSDLPDSFEHAWMHNAVKREWAAFRDAIVDGKPVAITGEYGRKIIAIIEAAYASDKSRREEKTKVQADITPIVEALAKAHADPRLRVAASSLVDLTRAEALAVQGAVLKLLGEAVPVCKVAAPPGLPATGAPIPAGMVIGTGDAMELGARDLAGLEIEIAVRLKADLTPDIAKAGHAAVLDVIEHFILGIELIGSRIDDRTKAGAYGPVADNMVTGGYVLGKEFFTTEPDIHGLAIALSCDGVVIQQETAKYPFGDAISPIIAFASLGDDHFGGFRKGMVITTGSLSPLLIVPRTGRIAISLGDFAPLSLTLQ